MMRGILRRDTGDVHQQFYGIHIEAIEQTRSGSATVDAIPAGRVTEPVRYGVRVCGHRSHARVSRQATNSIGQQREFGSPPNDRVATRIAKAVTTPRTAIVSLLNHAAAMAPSPVRRTATRRSSAASSPNAPGEPDSDADVRDPSRRYCDR